MQGLVLCCFIIFFNQVSAADVAIQNVLDTASYLTKKAGISLGVASPNGIKKFATGYKNRERAFLLQPDDRIAIGSGTKTFTAVATLKHVEQGTFTLDEPAIPHMDAFVRKMTQKGLVQYLGPQIYNVTIRQLLDMTAGVKDFDSKYARVWQINHPNADMDLDQMLDTYLVQSGEEGHENNKLFTGQDIDTTSSMFDCFPGRCGAYSSTNYLLLGMLLAQKSGAKHWMDYDQSSFMTDALRRQMPKTLFPVSGECSEFTDVHGYQRAQKIDVHRWACNNAFTVANALSTSPEIAIFYRALLGKPTEVLAPNMVKEMVKLRWLETGLGNKVSSGQFYGMGVRDLSAQLALNPLTSLLNPEVFTSGMIIGHDGARTGFSTFSGYVPRRDFSISFTFNVMEAASQMNFITRKVYDITSMSTPPVDNPLQATYQKKAEFLQRPIFTIARRAMLLLGRG